MELKYGCSGHYPIGIDSSNRTFMELKFVFHEHVESSTASSNRTFMELKLMYAAPSSTVGGF